VAGSGLGDIPEFTSNVFIVKRSKYK